MARLVDFTGRVFGRLTVERRGPPNHRYQCVMWLCRCACGNTKSVSANSLRSGRTTSCGCFRKEVFATNRARSMNGGVHCKRRQSAEDTIAEVFRTDPRELLRRLGIRLAGSAP